jgi:hypothetical protein
VRFSNRLLRSPPCHHFVKDRHIRCHFKEHQNKSMDENNCCLAVRIFIEKHGKYLFPLTGACAVIIAAFHYYHDLIGNWHAIEDRLAAFAVPRFVARGLAVMHMTFGPA